MKKISQSGNRTQVYHVTGGDTYHYTNWECSDESSVWLCHVHDHFEIIHLDNRFFSYFFFETVHEI